MEVHHHSHTARKKWTHYFWEFLMLFLAVFCGFLAENQREHYVEAHRAKDYAKSFYADLKSDSAEIRKGIRYVRFFISALDSISSIAGSNSEKTSVPGKFYYYIRHATHTYPIDWNRSTLNQVIQSGNLRYLKNKELVNKINQYYALQDIIYASGKTEEDHREIIRSLRNKTVDDRYFSLFSNKVDADSAVDNRPVSPQIDTLMHQSLPLQKGADQYLPELLNHLTDRRGRLAGHYISRISKALLLSAEIMSLLKKEYHLE